MKLYKFTPAWRSASEEIQFAHQPPKRWFDSLTLARGTQSFRFCLKADGSIYFGDSMFVMHQDIMHVEIPSTGETLLVGAVRKGPKSGIWRFYTLQYWSNTPAIARKLLVRLVDWQEAMKELGQDPCLTLGWSDEDCPSE